VPLVHKHWIDFDFRDLRILQGAPRDAQNDVDERTPIDGHRTAEPVEQGSDLEIVEQTSTTGP
jgi:hypothetical protein